MQLLKLPIYLLYLLLGLEVIKLSRLILEFRMFSIGVLGYYYLKSLLSWQLGIGNKQDLQRHVT